MKSHARRLLKIAPFYVMEVHKQAQALQAEGRNVIHLSIGEPDFGAPPAVACALQAAVAGGKTGYTEAKGLYALRQRISNWYREQFDCSVPAEQIFITQGASGALTLACLSLINPGDEVLMPDPSYACNRHFVAAADGVARLLPCPPEQAWQLTAQQVLREWSDHTRGIMVASPANPTGTRIQAAVLDELVRACQSRGGFLICDEIYQSLVYDRPAETILNCPSVHTGWSDYLVVNSFSKYFGMTGWRLGWLVAPPQLVDPLERLAQNLTICAPTPAQHAALACFEPDTLAVCEQRRGEFAQRRNYVLQRLRYIGLEPACEPDGAFYVWFSVAHLCTSSVDWCRQLLHATGLCLVPGIDFSLSDGQQHVRLSYARDMETLQQGMDLLEAFVGRAERKPGNQES